MIAAKKEWQTAVKIAKALDTNHLLYDNNRLHIVGKEMSVQFAVSQAQSEVSTRSLHLQDLDGMLKIPPKDGGIPAGPVDSDVFRSSSWPPWPGGYLWPISYGHMQSTLEPKYLRPALKDCSTLRARGGYMNAIHRHRRRGWLMCAAGGARWEVNAQVVEAVLAAVGDSALVFVGSDGIRVGPWTIRGGEASLEGYEKEMISLTPRSLDVTKIDRTSLGEVVKVLKTEGSQAARKRNPRSDIITFENSTATAECTGQQVEFAGEGVPPFAVSKTDLTWLLSHPTSPDTNVEVRTRHYTPTTTISVLESAVSDIRVRVVIMGAVCTRTSSSPGWREVS